MNMTPTLNSCRPEFQVKSSRNWYLCWSVSWGVLPFWPMNTPFGNDSVGSSESGPMWLWKYEYWNRNSLRRPPLSTVFRLRFAEWKVFWLVPQCSGGDCGLAP